MAVEQDRFITTTIANENRKSTARNESSHISHISSIVIGKTRGSFRKDRKDLPPKRKIRREEENLGSCQMHSKGSLSIQLF